ncbi:MAG TPA: histidine kinase, partial [Nitrolancea sp.]|nr:histidine kinase [Nitrolancea sp.]
MCVLDSALTPPASSLSRSRSGGLRGRTLLAVRTIWVLVTAGALALFVASLPTYYRVERGYNGVHQQAADTTRAGLLQIGFPLTLYAVFGVVLVVLLAAVFAGVGALLFWRKSDDLTTLFISLTLVAFGVIWPNTLDDFVLRHPALRLPTDIVNAFGLGGFFFLCYVFPDGRFVPRWTRPIAIAWVGFIAFANFFPGRAIPGAALLVLIVPALILLFGGSMLYAQIYRFRHDATPLQRQQIKWVSYSLAAALVTFVIGALVSALPVFNRSPVAAALFALASGSIYVVVFLLVPVSIGFAVLRYRLWDIDPIVNHTLVYGGLTVCIVGLYVVVVAELGVLFSTSGNLVFSLIATGLVAVVFQPLRLSLQRGVNRLMYGERADPYAVLTALGQRLESTLAPETILPTIVQSVAEALKLPYAAIALRRSDELTLAAERGTAPGDTSGLLLLPLSYQHEAVGELRLAPRASGEPFSPADRHLLDGLARQAGIAVRAVGLTLELQQARERLVNAREEERRRLRRDLHDDLGSQLAGLNMQLGILRSYIGTDPDAAESLVQELRQELREAIGSVRQIAHNLRPPVLDDLGLRAALQARAQQHGSAALRVEICLPDDLPPLSAASEAAIYRIVEEALTNVARHAQATHCRVQLAVTSAIELTIEDNGIGIS